MQFTDWVVILVAAIHRSGSAELVDIAHYAAQICAGTTWATEGAGGNRGVVIWVGDEHTRVGIPLSVGISAGRRVTNACGIKG